MNFQELSFDYAIVGGGVVGITIARELVLRKSCSVAVLEKETHIARHASGRNSGVLHAGFYYSPYSLKAKFCRDGNRLMRDFCLQRDLPMIQTGKVVVAPDESAVKPLYELERRGKANGVNVQIIGEEELKDLEPNARTCQKALYSPDTAVVDPVKVCAVLADDARSKGATFLFDTMVTGVKKNQNVVVASSGEIRFNHLINCAGMYADRIAHLFGVGTEYRMLPFRGNYYELRSERTNLICSNIYPVPDLRNPFLGVHFTKTVYGQVIVGPTATPVLGREAYRGFIDSEPGEALSILSTGIMLWLRNEANFRSIVRDEIRKYIKPWFVQEARQLVPAISAPDLVPSDHCGIRAQLVSLKERKLVDDFVILQRENTTHILNAVSPAFTCSLSFAKYVVDVIEGKQKVLNGSSEPLQGQVVDESTDGIGERYVSGRTVY